MFDKLDVLSVRAHELAHALIRETPPGQSFNTASPVYLQLQAALQETLEHVKQLEAEAIRSFEQEIADLPPIPPPPEAAPPVCPVINSDDLEEGTITFQFEKDHMPDVEKTRTQIAQLLALGGFRPESQVGGSTLPEDHDGSLWSYFGAAEPSPPKKVQTQVRSKDKGDWEEESQAEGLW